MVQSEPFMPKKIWQAKQRVKSFVQKTPLLQSHTLSNLTKKKVYLKLETANAIGAFKLRGAANKILTLSTEERKKGVTTFSTGNHGLAVSYVAKSLGIKAVVCVSNGVPQEKIDALSRFGADLEVVGESQNDAGQRCKELEKLYGMTIIPPFDDEEVIAGQGTIGLELLEDLPEMDHCIIPLSGGGLLAGIGAALKSVDSTIRISGVSIQGASAMSESLKKGYPVDVPETKTMADSLLGGIGANNRFTLRMVRELMDELVLLSEPEIEAGMSHLVYKEQVMVEGAAAVGAAALLENKLELPGDSIVLIISGKNGDISALKERRNQPLNDKKGACL
ncbi:threonine dehydratase [Salinibacillus kushneri]|uniref:threonine ammonia-lyase n=2 Tax=Salinibacillus kushneri TaxID=237682 RepID=A0A1I0CKA0_9BACI|nr:threonine dehydratase [Salinibacillus kushneri]